MAAIPGPSEHIGFVEPVAVRLAGEANIEHNANNVRVAPIRGDVHRQTTELIDKNVDNQGVDPTNTEDNNNEDVSTHDNQVHRV